MRWKKKSFHFEKNLERLATSDTRVAQFVEELEETLQDEKLPSEDTVEFTGPEAAGYGILFMFVAYFLFRWSKDLFDHRRALNETAVAERRIAIIKSMVDDGWPPDVAEAIATRCLEAIANRTKDDPVLFQVLETAKKYLPLPKGENEKSGA